MRAPTDDRGQTVPLLALLLGAAMACALAVAQVSARTSARARAESAADAVALAAASGTRADADAIAAANGAVLVTLTRTGDDVTVVVQRGDRRATARATVHVVVTGR